MELNHKFDEMQRTWNEFQKDALDRIKNLEKKGSVDPLVEEKLSKMNAAIDQYENELKTIRTAMARPGAGEPEKKRNEHKEAFVKYMRTGSEAEIKGLSVNDNVNGGYFVESDLAAEIVKNITEISPMRQLASIIGISGDGLKIRRQTGVASASWAGEQASRSETNTPTLGLLEIPAHEIYAAPRATQQILEDANINVEAWLAGEVTEAFADAEAAAFITGNGVGKPRGIMTYTSGTSDGQVEQVVTGSASAVASAGIVNIVYKLKAAYKNNASWMINRATLGSIRKLADSTGHFLWKPGLDGMQPSTLMGYPVFEADDVAVEASGALVAAFGNFQAAYQIVDKVGISVLRDPYSAKPEVEFYTRKRVGGAVKNYEAFKILKCST